MTSPRALFASPWARGIGALLLLTLIGIGAWKSIPPRRVVFDANQVAANRLLTKTAPGPFVSPVMRGGAIVDGSDFKLPPGSSLEFELLALNVGLSGRFQATTASGGIVEIVAVGENGSTVVLTRRMAPAELNSDAAEFHFLVDIRALPSGASRVLLRVPASSSGTMRWHDLRLAAREEFPVIANCPFPFLAFDGLYLPSGEEGAILTHAPGRVSLAVPPGERRVRFAFGLNPAVMAQPGYASDGAEFKVILDSPDQEPATLLDRLLTPDESAGSRALQTTTISIANRESAILRLITSAGPQGQINWDSTVWRDFQIEP